METKKQILLKEKFVKAFYRLVRIAKIHHENNPLLIECAKDFVRCITRLSKDDGYLTIQFVGKRICLQGKKLVCRPEINYVCDNMFYYFEKRQIQGLRFHTTIRNASFRHLLIFAHHLNRAEQQTSPLSWLIRGLQKSEFSWAEIIHPPRRDLQQPPLEKKEKARKSYQHMLASVREVAQKVSSHRPTGLGKTIRVVQNMVDLIMEDDPLFRALSTIRIYDDYTYVHSVNVAILSMCIGKRIMLSRRSLERLGLCGLLHDLGKLEVPKAILNKPGKLSDEEFEVMKKHSLTSVRLITKIQADRDRKANILLPPFEHHLKYDLSGYPQTNRKKELSLFGRIVAIADVYDAITSPRVYRLSTLSPDCALGLMLKGSGTDFDPILLKVFINMLGVYPVGTLLKLDKGVGLVMDKPESSDGERPWVVMLKRDREGRIKKGNIADLSERDPCTGKYRTNIVESFHPADYGIQAAEFLL